MIDSSKRDFTPVFLGSGRCFHTMDWFRSCQTISSIAPIFVTDNYGGEGFIPLLEESDRICELIIIDKMLFNNGSALGHVWRNLVKLFLVPFQIIRLKSVLKKIERPFVFAHSTYYAFLASFCGIDYIATPQGSEVLVRPVRSSFYKAFLRRSLVNARFVTVDSHLMSSKLTRWTKAQIVVVQNGIDISSIRKSNFGASRSNIVSIRGIEKNYRIREIILSRDDSVPEISLTFCFPFVEEGYFTEIKSMVRDDDKLAGRLSRMKMYELFSSALCVLSIPISDSSPRSVYEAIFCGAAVLATEASYIRYMPKSMRDRVVVVNLDEPTWLQNGIDKARAISLHEFHPCEQALDMFDQLSSMRKVLDLAGSPKNS